MEELELVVGIELVQVVVEAVVAADIGLVAAAVVVVGIVAAEADSMAAVADIGVAAGTVGTADKAAVGIAAAGMADSLGSCTVGPAAGATHSTGSLLETKTLSDDSVSQQTVRRNDRDGDHKAADHNSGEEREEGKGKGLGPDLSGQPALLTKAEWQRGRGEDGAKQKPRKLKAASARGTLEKVGGPPTVTVRRMQCNF